MLFFWLLYVFAYFTPVIKLTIVLNTLKIKTKTLSNEHVDFNDYNEQFFQKYTRQKHDFFTTDWVWGHFESWQTHDIGKGRNTKNMDTLAVTKIDRFWKMIKNFFGWHV